MRAWDMRHGSISMPTAPGLEGRAQGGAVLQVGRAHISDERALSSGPTVSQLEEKQPSAKRRTPPRITPVHDGSLVRSVRKLGHRALDCAAPLCLQLCCQGPRFPKFRNAPICKKTCLSLIFRSAKSASFEAAGGPSTASAAAASLLISREAEGEAAGATRAPDWQRSPAKTSPRSRPPRAAWPARQRNPTWCAHHEERG